MLDLSFYDVYINFRVNSRNVNHDNSEHYTIRRGRVCGKSSSQKPCYICMRAIAISSSR